MNGRTSNITIPTEFPAAYSDEDQKDIRRILRWLMEPEQVAASWSQTQLGKRAGVNLGTLNQILQAKYQSPPSKHLKKVIEVIDLDRSRHEHRVVDMPYVHTSVDRAVAAACKRARMYRSFCVVAAFVGTGKTYAVKHHAELAGNVILLEARPGLAAYVMLDMLVQMTSASVRKSSRASRGTKDEMFDAIVHKLKGTDALLIVDEADTLTEQAMEYIRRLRDLAQIGVVLTGTERLQPLVRDPRGQFGQISSRVNYWPPVITAITEEDAEALARAAFADDEEATAQLTPEVLDAFWQVCDGSARVLCEAIVPGVRDYGLSKGRPLTPELVFKVGTDVLGFRVKRRA